MWSTANQLHFIGTEWRCERRPTFPSSFSSSVFFLRFFLGIIALLTLTAYNMTNGSIQTST